MHVFFIVCAYIYFFPLVSVRAPKWCFFNPNMGTGLKKHHFGASSGSPKKIIEVQDGGGGTAYNTRGRGYPLFAF